MRRVRQSKRKQLGINLDAERLRELVKGHWLCVCYLATLVFHVKLGADGVSDHLGTVRHAVYGLAVYNGLYQ